MTSLINIVHPKLNEKVLKVLTQNKIITTLDFLRNDSEKLMIITKLSLPQILAIRASIFEKYAVPFLKAKDIYLLRKGKNKFMDTGIESLNRIIGGGLPLGNITELCGLAESGKTQLCFQIAINCVKDAESKVLYIDTKGDYSSVRIQKILDCYGYSHKEMAIIMSKIKVIRIWTMEELTEIFNQLKQRSIIIDNLLLIIVDSLPCLMFQHLGDNNKIGLKLLNLFVNNCKFLCNKFQLSIICVNILTRWVEQEVYDMEDDMEAVQCTFGPTNWLETRSRCLGRYWQHIPALVLTLDKYEDVNIIIKISVTKSVYGKCNENCLLHVNATGVTQ